MTKGDALFWIMLVVVAGAFVLIPLLRRQSDWVSWAIIAGGALAIVTFLVVFPLH